MRIDIVVRLGLCCTLALDFTACATTRGGRVHQPRNTFHSSRTYAQGIGGGAVAGAVVGALVGGFLTGGRGGWNPRGAAIGAAIGTAGGATLGGNYARRKVEERRRYQNLEGSLDEAIGRASATRQEAARFNSELAGELRNVRSDANSQRAALAEARAMAESLNGEIQRQQSNLQQARASGVPESERDRLQTEINGLQAERRQLEGYIDHIAPTGRPGAEPAAL